MYKYLSNLSFSIIHNIDRANDIANSFSLTQLKSKKWLVDVLAEKCNITHPNILILGGWYGSFLVPMLIETINPSKIILTDINRDVVNVARSLHKTNSIVKCEALDACNPNKQYVCDIVINTSCEHMTSVGEKAVSNSGCLYVLQSCDDANDPGHVNTSKDTESFVTSAGLSQILFKGRLDLGHKNRFMVIGYK